MEDFALKSKKIALDCDGVLLNYNVAWKDAFLRAFNVDLPHVQDSYHAHNQYGVAVGDVHYYKDNAAYQREMLFKAFTDDGFETMPALEGALEANLALVDAGYECIVVTAVPEYTRLKRIKNLADLGFKISDVICTYPRKAETLTAMMPVAFVDDQRMNFHGVPPEIQRILIHKDVHDSPNHNNVRVDKTYTCLYDFVKEFLQ